MTDQLREAAQALCDEWDGTDADRSRVADRFDALRKALAAEQAGEQAAPSTEVDEAQLARLRERGAVAWAVEQAAPDAPRPLFAAKVAQRKWDELQSDGYRMQRIYFEADGKAGTIDAWGKVMWDSLATAAPVAPQAVELPALPDERLSESVQRIGALLSAALNADHPAMLDWARIGFAIRAQAVPAPQAEDHLSWACQRWHDEVFHRPMVNVNRRPLDDTWRQVIRHFGGNPDELIGPDHDTRRGEITTNDWLAMTAAPPPADAQAEQYTLDQIAEACVQAEIPDSKFESISIVLAAMQEQPK